MKLYVASSWRNAYLPEKVEPELMYKLFTAVCCTMDEVAEVLRQ